MPDGGYTLISDTTLPTSVNEFSISGIPQTYQHLMVVLQGASDGNNTDLAMTVNNTGGSIYHSLSQTYNMSLGNYVLTGSAYARMTFNDVIQANTQNVFWIEIMDYSSTTGFKCIRLRSTHSAGNDQVYTHATVATNTAISSLQFRILNVTQKWTTATQYRIYGIYGV